MDGNKNPAPLVSPKLNQPQTMPTPPATKITKKASKFSLKFTIFTIIFLLFTGGATAGYLYKAPIHLVSKPTPTPTVSISLTPTPDPTEGWKTYKADGFSIKYPTTWESSSNGLRYIGRPNDPTPILGDFSSYAGISFQTFMNSKSAERFIDNSGHIQNRNKIIIDSKESQKLTGMGGVLGEIPFIEVLTPMQDGKILLISFSNFHKDVSSSDFDQILSTFKFRKNETDKVNAGSQGIGGCAITGLSNNLCVEQEDVKNTIWTRESFDYYVCYKTAICERQTDGKCGWTQTKELNRCIESYSIPYEDN